jgi:hypothetical protein
VSCPHGNGHGDCDRCDEADARDAKEAAKEKEFESALEALEIELQLALRCMERASVSIRKTIAANDHAPSQVREWFSLIDADAMLTGHRLVRHAERIERDEADEFSGRARAVLGSAGRTL